MEIHRIEICNINSLKGNNDIDFMSGPLKGQDLFAIIGKTGSGKSTILDAITLALYNRVPRLDGKAGEGDVRAKDPYKRLPPGDTKNCLTRGEKRGYAKVVFEASGQLYKAEWLCELKNINFTGSHTLYLVEQVDGIEKATVLRTNNLLKDGKGAVAENVVEIVGLGYDQFCKSCILAQNSFANFLKASDNEKTDILEKITGTSIYGKIADVIVKGYQKAVKEKTALDDKVSGITRDLKKPDVLEQLKNEKDCLKQEKERLVEELGNIEEGLNWWRTYHHLEQEKKKAAENKKSADGKMEELRPDRDRLNRHDSLNEGLQLFDKEIERNKELKTAEEEIVLAKQALQDNIESINGKKKEKSVEEEALKTDQSKLGEIAWIKHIKDNITFIQSEYQLLDKALSSLQAGATKYNPEFKDQNEKVLMDEVALITEDLDSKLTQEGIREHLGDVNKELGICINAADLFPKMEKFQQLASANKNDSDNIPLLNSRYKDYDEAVQRLTYRKNSLENENLTVKRGLLVEGEPCELCGATAHPYATKAVFDQIIADIEKDLKEQIEKRQKINGERQQLERKIHSREGQMEELDAAINQLKDTIKANDESFLTVFEKYQEEEIIRELKSKAGEKEGWIEEQRKTENTLALIELRDILLDTKTHRENLDTYLPEGWYSKRLADKDGYAQSLKEDIKRYNRADSVVTQHNEKIQRFEASINALNDLIPGLEKKIEERKNTRDKKKRNSKAAVQALDDWIKAFNESNDIPVSREEFEQQKADDTNWNKLREIVRIAKEASATTTALLVKANENLTNHNNDENKPLESEEQLEGLKKLEDRKLKGSNGDDGVLKQLEIVSYILSKHEDAEKAIADEKDNIEAAEKNVELWERFYNMLGKNKGDKEAKAFRLTAQNYTLGLLLKYANDQLHNKFTKRYELKKQNDSTLEIMVKDGTLGERYASSLSGGETFMVSLALALGLSKISSGSVSIKNLFIDEGFGSLDEDTQKTVINTLNTLRSQGKRVGFISHTAALVNDDSIYKIRVEQNDGEKFSRIKWD